MNTSGHVSSFRRLLAAVLVFGCLASLLSAKAVVFDIPAQPAASALQLFGRQAGVEVVYPSAELKKIQAAEVKGELEAAAALTRLLAGTGYSATQTGASSFVVTAPVVEKPGSIEGSVREEKSGRPVAGAKVTLAGTDISVLTDRRGRFTLDDVSPGEHVLMVTADGMQDTKVTDVSVRAGGRLSLSAIGIPVRQEGPLQLEPYSVSAKKNDGVVELDPYAVEGRRERPFVTGNIDIPRTIDDVQPYYIFDLLALNRSGATNIEDFLRQRLTMNTMDQSNSQISGTTDVINGNTSTINLRGLGADKTLVLVNGRRLPNLIRAGDSFQSDINGIPLGSIERIEVMPSSASGIYGGNAIGGVINIILKKDYSGAEATLRYDNTWDTDAPRRSFSFSYGAALENSRTHVGVNVSFSDSKGLLLNDRRQLLEESMARIQVNSPTFFFTPTNPWLGSLPNIVSSSLAPLVLRDGRALGSAITYVPAGTSGTTSAAALADGLLANAGKANLDNPLTTQSPNGLLLPFGSTPETRALQLTASREMSSRLTLSADYSYTENRSETIYNPFGSVLAVAATVPTNPFSASVRVRFPDATRVPSSTQSTTHLGTLGFLLDLKGGWTVAGDVSYSRNEYEYHLFQIDTDARTAALRAGAINLFVDTLQFPIDTSKYLIGQDFEGRSELLDLSLRGSGKLPSLPWGEPNITVGLERRHAHTPARIEAIEYTATPSLNAEWTWYERTTVTDAGYAELHVPLTKADVVPLVHGVELQLAGRMERFDVDTGTPSKQVLYNQVPVQIFYASPTLNGQPYFSRANYDSRDLTYGLKYDPIKSISIRASFGTAFLPPTPTQLLREPAPLPLNRRAVDDPKTGLRYMVDTLRGGNPELRPQNSKSTNIGIIWNPRTGVLSGTRINVEYYRIQQFDAIGSLDPQAVLNLESEQPSRVTRDASGMITLIDAGLQNLYKRDTSGIDFSASFSHKISGSFVRLDLLHTRILHLKNQYARTLPEYDAVGFHPREGGTPKNQSSAVGSVEIGNWLFGWSTRFFDSYKMVGAPGGPFSRQFANGGIYQDTLYIIPQGSDRVPSQLYHDLLVGYTWGRDARVADGGQRGWKRLLGQGSVQFGVRNVFDKAPPLDVAYSNNFYLSTFGDTRLRSYWISIRKQF